MQKVPWETFLEKALGEEVFEERGAFRDQ